jgi:hypothetical protein
LRKEWEKIAKETGKDGEFISFLNNFHFYKQFTFFKEFHLYHVAATIKYIL